jgi:hypothetical protein
VQQNRGVKATDPNPPIDDALQKHFLYWKRLYCAAKAFPALETTLLHCKTICSPGNDFAKQQNHFLRWKRLCWTAKAFPALETTLLYSKTICSLGNDFAA